jgi:hypothetical protein
MAFNLLMASESKVQITRDAIKLAPDSVAILSTLKATDDGPSEKR